MPEFDYCLIKHSLSGLDNECGDAGIGIVSGDEFFIAHIDALGHGKKAHEAAERAQTYLKQNYQKDLIEVMNGLHSHLIGTVGVVASLCRINSIEGKISHVGTGNITCKVFGGVPVTFISRDGVLGYSRASPKIQVSDFIHGDILVMSSDGVKEHYRPEEYPDLLYGSAGDIAAKIIESLGKDDDDVSCSVLRYR